MASCPGKSSMLKKPSTHSCLLISLVFILDQQKPANRFCKCSPDIYLCDQCFGKHCANDKFLAQMAETFKRFEVIVVSDDDEGDADDESEKE